MASWQLWLAKSDVKTHQTSKQEIDNLRDLITRDLADAAIPGLWFALNGAVLIVGLLVVARMLGPVAGTRALLLSPLVLASDIPIGTLQVGNLQAIVFSLAMIAMVLLAQRRYAAGAALLAFATVSKLRSAALLELCPIMRECLLEAD